MFCIHLFIYIRIFCCVCVCLLLSAPQKMLQHWRSPCIHQLWGQVVDFWESLRSMIGGSELPEVMKKGFLIPQKLGKREEWVDLTSHCSSIGGAKVQKMCFFRCVKSAAFQSLLVKLLAPFGWKVCCHDALSGGSVVRPVAMFWSYLRCRFAS